MLAQVALEIMGAKANHGFVELFWFTATVILANLMAILMKKFQLYMQ